MKNEINLQTRKTTARNTRGRWKRLFSTLVHIVTGAQTGLAEIHYVTKNNPGAAAPYSTWATAARTIQDAVDVAYPGDTIYVADGVYDEGSRVDPYTGMSNRVFVGKAIRLQSVNGPLSTAIVGAPDTRYTNGCGNASIRGVAMTNWAVLSGFTIRNGHTKSSGLGGGVYCYGTNAVIENCVITACKSSEHGGGVRRGIIRNSWLTGNWARYDGGAAYYSSLTNCYVAGNAAGSDGGGCYYATADNCTIISNRAGYGGGGLYTTAASGCLVTRNEARDGGGVGSGSTVGLFNSTVSLNRASRMGGGTCGSLYIQNCIIESNSAALGGGSGNGYFVYGTTLKDCIVRGNMAGDGGGVCRDPDLPAMHCENTLLLDNVATNNGGAAWSTVGGYASYLYRCVVRGNRAGNVGGGLHGGDAYDCLVVSNRAVGGAGCYESTLYGCTVAANAASGYAGGTYGGKSHNSIVYYNTAPNNPNWQLFTTATSFVHCCASPLPVGPGNRSAAPQFVAQASGNFRLGAGSPCINAGTNKYVDLNDGELDLDGTARIKNGIVDMGAYESAGAAPVNDAFAARTALTGSYLALAASNLSATKEAGEPSHAGNAGGSSVWWKWTAPAAGQVTMETSGSSFDTLLAVYAGTAVNALSQIAANDDAPRSSANYSLVTFNATAGVTYNIAVDGFGGAVGSIALKLTLSNAPAAGGVIALSGSMAFGDVTVGSVVQLTLTIANSGAGPLTVRGVSCPAGFSGNWTGTIPAGGSQAIGIAFAPASPIAYGGYLVVNSDASGGTATAYASGRGVVTTVRNTALLGDFSGDRMTGIATYWSAGGSWNMLAGNGQPLPAVQLGATGMVAVAADYDGDGKADPAVYHADVGNWYILQSSTATLMARNWGWYAALAVPADYDGDGRADIATYVPETGQWAILQSGDGRGRFLNWGWSQAIPVPADYDGDGKADIATYTPATGQWAILQSSDGRGRFLSWGWSQAIPVPADYDGDGKADVATYVAAEGNWYVLKSSNGALFKANWGYHAAAPVAGDYDGDGKADLAVYVPSAGSWYILQSRTATMRSVAYGWSEAVPVQPQFQINRRYFPAP